MKSTERAQGKPRVEEYQAAVSEHVASILNTIQDPLTEDVLTLEIERATWDFIATYTEILMRAYSHAIANLEDCELPVLPPGAKYYQRAEDAVGGLWHSIEDAPEDVEVLLCEPHMPDRALDCYFLARKDAKTGWEATHEGLELDPSPDSVFMHLPTGS